VPWACTFRDPYATRAVGTPLDVALHPTQLYESAATLLLFLGLWWLSKRKRFHGQVTLVYLFLYAAARFVIEFYRGDAARGTVGGWISTSQFVALLIVVAVAALYPYLSRRRRLEPAPA
jgi:phosphatidylglycerol:prolipoprotein diacylglycerol transferase